MVTSNCSKEQWCDISNPASDVQAWASENEVRHALLSDVTSFASLSEDDDLESDVGSTQNTIPITPPRTFDVGMSRTLEGRSVASLRGRAMEMRRSLLSPFTCNSETDVDPFVDADWSSKVAAVQDDDIGQDGKLDGGETLEKGVTHMSVDKYTSDSRTACASPSPILRALLMHAWPLRISLLLVAVLLYFNSTAFAPLCSLSHFRTTSLCQVQPALYQDNVNRANAHPDFPTVMKIQDRAFTTLFESATALAVIAPEIKEARLATNDLAILVKHSELGGKDRLAQLLDGFSADAKVTARGMNRFYAQLSTAIDNVGAVGDYAIRSLQHAENSMSRYLPTILTSRASDEALITSFEFTCSTLAVNLKRLIVTAESLLEQLDVLRLRLDTILEIVSLEKKDIAVDREKILASLWTALGQNQGPLSQFERNLALLLKVETFRNEALVHVVNALEALAQFSDELEELSKRVATPELVGGKLPLHVQLESIRKGVERLDRSRQERSVSERVLPTKVVHLQVSA